MSRDFYAALKADLASWMQTRRRERATPNDIVHTVRNVFAGLNLPGSVTYAWLGQVREAGVDASETFKNAHGLTDGVARVGIEIRHPHGAPLVMDVPVTVTAGEIVTPSTMHVQGSAHLIGQDAVDALLARLGVGDDFDFRGSRLHMFIPDTGSAGPVANLRSMRAQIDGPSYATGEYSLYRRFWQMDADQPWKTVPIDEDVPMSRASQILHHELRLGAGDMRSDDEVVDMMSVDDAHMTFESIKAVGGPIGPLLQEAGVELVPVSVSNKDWIDDES